MADYIDSQTKALLIRRLEEAERILHHCRQVLEGREESRQEIAGPPVSLRDDEDVKEGERVVYGTFDGEHMKGEDGQLYPVPANYASKSKLVEGDNLKLIIQEDGAFVYKQIGPIERRRVKGVFTTNGHGQYVVRTSEGVEYRILLASVTFYHIEEGDEVTVLLPEEGEAIWGAVDNVVKPGGPSEETEE